MSCLQLITAAAWGAMTRAQGSAGPTFLITDPAVDMWALGAVAWEAFTGKPLFGDQFSDADVMAMLLGQQQLPFERDPSLFVLFSDPEVSTAMLPAVSRSCSEATVARRVTMMFRSNSFVIVLAAPACCCSPQAAFVPV